MTPVIRSFSLIALAALLLSCSVPLESAAQRGDGTCSVTLLLSGETSADARTITTNFASVAAEWRLVLTSAGRTTRDIRLSAGSALTVSGLEPGTWDIAVTGYNAADEVAAEGALTGAVLALGQSRTVTVPVAVSVSAAGSGTFAFTVSFPATATITHVRAYLDDVPGEYMEYTVADTGAMHSVIVSCADRATHKTATSGTWTLTVELWRGEIGNPTSTRPLTLVESVNIWDNLHSDRWLDSSGNLAEQRVLALDDFASNNVSLAGLSFLGGQLRTLVGVPTVFSPLVVDYELYYTDPAVTAIITRANAGQTIEYYIGNTEPVWQSLSGSAVNLTIPAIAQLLIRVTAADGNTQRTYTLSLQRYFTITYYPNGALGAPVAVTVNAGLTHTMLQVDSAPLNYANIRDGIALRLTHWKISPTGTGGTDFDPAGQFPVSGNYSFYARWSVIGGRGPAGGLVFYDKGDYSDGWRYLEVQDIHASDEETASWVTPSNLALGGNHAELGWGKSNTLRNSVNQTGGAIWLSQTLNVNGYHDWFLPSTDELSALYTQLVSASFGSFIPNYYWTSTETAANQATIVNLNDGSSMSNAVKAVGYNFRPIRAFADSEPLYIVMYHANGASGGAVPEDSYHYRAGQVATARENSGGLTRAGLTFAGWNTQANGIGTNYNPGDPLPFGNDDIVLYARWQ